MDRRSWIGLGIVLVLLALVLLWWPWPPPPDLVSVQTPAPPTPVDRPHRVPSGPPPAAPTPTRTPASTEPARPLGVKVRPDAWDDDLVYLEELVSLAVGAVDPDVPAEDLDIFCTVDHTRCRVRAPLLDPDLDEDGLWEVTREAVADAVGTAADAALTRVQILEPPDDLPLMEIEVTLVVD